MQTEKMYPSTSCPTLFDGKRDGVYMHYYQHHIGDYRKDTSHLSLLEHGIYRQLLDLYYLSEKPLDANALRLICARTEEEQAITLQLLDEFFTKKGNKYYHSRCDAEIIAYHGKKIKAKASAEIRWNKNSKLQDANALPTDSERNANHKPLTINHKPLTNINTYTEDFAIFWSAYPTKTAKDAAFKAWKKVKPNLDDVMTALSWQRDCEQWRKGFIPNPSTYLNQGRWKDEAPVEELW
jgi:uncharacterized protein YdaU (DUF1376 family)